MNILTLVHSDLKISLKHVTISIETQNKLRVESCDSKSKLGESIKKFYKLECLRKRLKLIEFKFFVLLITIKQTTFTLLVGL